MEKTDAEKRDEALELLERTRATLIREGHAAARVISILHGRVTSIEVFVYLRAKGYAEQLDAVDPRWIGCVFRQGWERIGYEPTGSHKRPVAVWKLKGTGT